MIKVKRGNLYYANLNPVIGSEQGGTRPVVILQNNIGNKESTTVIVAPLTTKSEYIKRMPTHIRIPAFEKLKQESIVMLEQIRVIDKIRLKTYLGKLNNKQMSEINNALLIELHLNKKNKYFKNTLHSVK